jgi:hypothetical protein
VQVNLNPELILICEQQVELMNYKIAHYLTVGVSIWTDLLFPAETFYTLKQVIIVLRMEIFIYMTALTPTFLTEAFHGFPHAFQANSVVLRRIGDYRILPDPFQFIFHTPWTGD